MTSIIIAFPKLEDAKGIKNLLIRNGFPVAAICTTGGQALGHTADYGNGIILCSYKLADMMYDELHACMPSGFEMLLLASKAVLNETAGHDIIRLTLPLKLHDLVNTVNMMIEGIERKRRLRRLRPQERSEEELVLIREAKYYLIERNHMTEEEAHRYMQKCSMDSGTNLVETAQMVLSILRA